MVLAIIVTIVVVAFLLALLIGLADQMVGSGDFFGAAIGSFLLLLVAGFLLWGAFELVTWVWSLA